MYKTELEWMLAQKDRFAKSSKRCRLELSPAIQIVLEAPPGDQAFDSAGTVWRRQEASLQHQQSNLEI